LTKSSLPAHRWLPEPELSFHPTRREDRTAHPLFGLINFGPYSRSLINKVMDPIRVAVIAPHGALVTINSLLRELEQEHQPRERRAYLPKFLGFSRIFGLRILRASDNVCIELPPDVDDDVSGSQTPHLVLAEKLTQALSSLITNRSDFDMLLIYLPSKWRAGFEGGEGEDFDLHDYLKAITATSGIPTQIILQDSALTYFCRCSVMWRLGIALYCKAGGVPWKLADTDPDTAFIGLSYAMRPVNGNKPRFVTCCSQVFDADGAGLEFIAYETDEVHIERENPFLNRPDMRRVMARSLALYQNRHAGRSPKRVVVHKSTEFKPEEIDGCFDAWTGSEGLDLIRIQQHVFWRGILIDPPHNTNSVKGIPAGYPCQRGTYLQLGGRDVLLWTQGNAPSAVGGKNFYKEGKSIPSPLLLTRYAGHGAWDEGCRHVLGLTKMDWNNDSLYDRLPVTMGYAKVLARTLKRMPQIATKPYEFRFFM
jgi:hypothetical protein